MSQTNLFSRITFNVNQCGGRPCIRDMRMRVKDVLDMLAAGATDKEILDDYPYLEPEDIRVCLECASMQVNHAVVITGARGSSWMHSCRPRRRRAARRPG
jgi:uncharacterized protein (DUF433 family)